jgi:hypothetical protein
MDTLEKVICTVSKSIVLLDSPIRLNAPKKELHLPFNSTLTVVDKDIEHLAGVVSISRC